MVIESSLRKDRMDRTQTAQVVYSDLKGVQRDVKAGTVLVDASTIPAPEPVPEPIEPEPVPLLRQPVAIGFAILTLLIGLTAAWLFKPVPEPPLRKFTISVDSIPNQVYEGPVVSPNGRMIVYTQGGNNSTLWIRDLDAVTPRELPDTQSGFRPFWAPGSDYVAYFKPGLPFILHKVSVDGGPSIPLCEIPIRFPRGGVWQENGTIIFGAGIAGDGTAATLNAVSAQGGEPTVFATADSTLRQMGLFYPAALPDGSLLYAVVEDAGAGALIVQKGKQRRVILDNRRERIAFPVYSPTGHIVYQRGFPDSKGIWAVPFDGTNVTGDQFPVNANGGYPSVSSDGTLVYRPAAVGANRPPGRLVWLDRQGRVDPIGDTRKGLQEPVLSPDEKQIAFSSVGQDNENIWLYDVERNIPTRFTFNSDRDGNPMWEPRSGGRRIGNPVWSPDGRWLAFQEGSGGINEIRVKSVGDSEYNTVIVPGGLGGYWPDTWSQDGRYLVYSHNTLGNPGIDMWFATLSVGENTVTVDSLQPFLRTLYSEGFGRLSPDGRYLAYESNESGQNEVYVVSFPDGSGKKQVSANGGIAPQWHPGGGELFYWESPSNDTGPMMVATVETQGGLRFSRPRKLFDPPQGVPVDLFSVSTDGQRFLTVQQGEAGEVPKTTITVVENWHREFDGQQ